MRRTLRPRRSVQQGKYKEMLHGSPVRSQDAGNMVLIVVSDKAMAIELSEGNKEKADAAVEKKLLDPLQHIDEVLEKNDRLLGNVAHIVPMFGKRGKSDKEAVAGSSNIYLVCVFTYLTCYHTVCFYFSI